MTAGPVTEVLPFSETQYLLRLQALSPAPRGQKGYDKAETDKLVKALIAEVLAAQERAALEHTKAEAAAEAVKYHSDDYAATRQPWEHKAAPAVTVEAAVNGQLATERHTRAADLEIAHRLANAERVQAEAEALLARAEETAAKAPPVLELPPAPKLDGDLAATIEARGAHIAECTAVFEAWRQAWDDWESARLAEIDREREALGESRMAVEEQRAGFVAELDRLGEVVPTVRSTVIAVAESPSERAERERVAS